MSYEDRTDVIYTLTDNDHPDGYKSLYKLYMAMEDPTEIQFARTYLDGHEHWETICALSWFKPYIARWRKELDLQMRSKALANIQAVAKDPDHKSSYEANKLLLAGGWKTKEEKDRVGRPSKDAIKQKAEELFKAKEETQEDYLRITKQ